MSSWTYISASIVVDTYMNMVNIKQYVEQVLSSAPKITGSERNAGVFVNPFEGHNTWKGADCDICPYKDSIQNCPEGGFTCDAEEDFECPEGEYQTVVVITIAGHMRDRVVPQTRKELANFIKYIRKQGWYIQNKAYSILD